MGKSINSIKVFALHETIMQFLAKHPYELRQAQVLMEVDNSAAGAANIKGRSRDTLTNDIVVRLFWLLLQYGLWLRGYVGCRPRKTGRRVHCRDRERTS